MHREVQGLFDNAKAQSASGKAMKAVFDALAKAFGQLTDAAVLRVFAKSIALTLLIFVAFGALLWWALDAAVNTWLVDHLPADYAATVAGFAALALGLVSCARARDDGRTLYQWTDRDGAVRFTSQRERIPRGRRLGAKPVEPGLTAEQNAELMPRARTSESVAERQEEAAWAATALPDAVRR